MKKIFQVGKELRMCSQFLETTERKTTLIKYLPSKKSLKVAPRFMDMETKREESYAILCWGATKPLRRYIRKSRKKRMKGFASKNRQKNPKARNQRERRRLFNH